VDSKRKSISDINAADGGEGSSLGSNQSAVDHAANGPRDIFCLKRSTVVEEYSITQVNDERKGIGLFPACRKPWLKVVVLVFFYKGIEDYASYALGLRIGALAQVEVVGAALNNHDDRIRIARFATAVEQWSAEDDEV
jgi:hypothetical protein